MACYSNKYHHDIPVIYNGSGVLARLLALRKALIPSLMHHVWTLGLKDHPKVEIEGLTLFFAVV